jgi:hypothetical protein
MEISLEARKRRGYILLPFGMSDVDAVHDILGGNRKEIDQALTLLSSPPEPMISFEPMENGRALVVTTWGRWNPVDQTAAERAQRYRKRKRGVTRDARDGNRDVTEPRARALLSSPLLSSDLSLGSERDLQASVGAKRSRRGKTLLGPDWRPSDALVTRMREKYGIDALGQEALDEFIAHWVSVGEPMANWDMAYQKHLLRLKGWGRAPTSKKKPNHAPPASQLPVEGLVGPPEGFAEAMRNAFKGPIE